MRWNSLNRSDVKTQAKYSGKYSVSKGGRLQFLWNDIIIANKIPTLNTSLYVFKFTDGVEANYPGNIIEENMSEKWDNGVIKSQLTEENFKHKSDIINSDIIPVGTPKLLHGSALGLDTNSDQYFTSRSQVWASQMEE